MHHQLVGLNSLELSGRASRGSRRRCGGRHRRGGGRRRRRRSTRRGRRRRRRRRGRRRRGLPNRDDARIDPRRRHLVPDLKRGRLAAFALRSRGTPCTECGSPRRSRPRASTRPPRTPARGRIARSSTGPPRSPSRSLCRSTPGAARRAPPPGTRPRCSRLRAKPGRGEAVESRVAGGDGRRRGRRRGRGGRRTVGVEAPVARPEARRRRGLQQAVALRDRRVGPLEGDPRRLEAVVLGGREGAHHRPERSDVGGEWGGGVEVGARLQRPGYPAVWVRWVGGGRGAGATCASTSALRLPSLRRPGRGAPRRTASASARARAARRRSRT